MQCVLSGELAKAYDALTLSRETSIEIFGQLWEVPAGAHAPLDRELQADYFEMLPKRLEERMLFPIGYPKMPRQIPTCVISLCVRTSQLQSCSFEASSNLRSIQYTRNWASQRSSRQLGSLHNVKVALPFLH